MIFASDLDRTLIYSNFFVKPEINDIVVVEQREGKNISFMTEKSIDLLNKIHTKLLFIPTTTRSKEQYERISVFQNTISPKYAIISNGGIILKDGEVDTTWSSIIALKMKNIISPVELIKHCNFFLELSQINSYRCCDDLFLYAVLKENTLEDEMLLQLTEVCSEYGYSVTKNGRKVYIIPSFINKWAPIEYIMELESEKEFISSGDSTLDLPMLINSIHSFIPVHGELYHLHREELSLKSNIHFTVGEGLLSSEEFLQNIIDGF